MDDLSPFTIVSVLALIVGLWVGAALAVPLVTAVGGPGIQLVDVVFGVAVFTLLGDAGAVDACARWAGRWPVRERDRSP